MITTQYDYSSGTGFVYDSTKIGFSGGKAVLLLIPNTGLVFTPDVSASTYDPSVLEYVGGVLRQKDQRPTHATAYASWATGLDLNWGNGTLTVTPANGATVSSGKLDLSGSTNKYVTFAATGNAANLMQGTIEFKVTPEYSGIPATVQVLSFTAEATSTDNLATLLEHYTDGNLYLILFDQTGATISTTFVPWVPVAGTTYTFVVQFDGIAGLEKIFVDGSLLVSDTNTFSRAGSVTVGAVGFRTDLIASNANFKMSNLAYYSTVVTPASAVLAPIAFIGTTVTLPLFTYVGTGSVLGYTAFAEADAGQPRYTMNGLYWNGSAWVASDESYTQANLKATIIANIATLPAANTLQIRAIYADSSAQSQIGAMTVTYSGQIYPTTNPTIAPNMPLTLDNLQAFTDQTTISGSDSVTFYLLIDSVPYWWDGAAWSVSDGTYAKSNRDEDIADNLSTLPVSMGDFVTPYALLHSADGSTTPRLTSLILTYNYFGPEPTLPNLCTVYGYIIDAVEGAIAGATVSWTVDKTYVNQGLFIAQGAITAVTDALGYFSVSLAETTTANTTMTASVKYPGQRGSFTFGKAFIPNAPTVNMATLVFAP